MKRSMLIVLLAILASSCAVTMKNGTRLYLFQRVLPLQVTHTCTDKAMLYQAGRGFVREIVGAAPVEVPLEPAVSGDDRISITIQSIDNSGKVLATYVEAFYLNYGSGGSQTWLITRDSGWGSGKVSRCQ